MIGREGYDEKDMIDREKDIIGREGYNWKRTIWLGEKDMIRRRIWLGEGYD